MRVIFLIVFYSILPRVLCSQAPYTMVHQYAWTVETDLSYGTAVNYMGALDTLRLDLYKPINDQLERPLLVLVHGGAWVAGCKNDLSWLAAEMAGRGYVVATVNYRLGWHKAAYVPAPICPYGDDVRNLYPTDSCEIIRAIYRAQQDVKGAIRWLKCRHLQDSTSLCRTVVGGESAGAFAALAVGLLDRAIEKPACSMALPDAPLPDPNLFNRTTLDCQLTTWSIPPGSLARPDLGDIDGNLQLNGYDANVQGILSFYGGVPVEAATENWISGPDTPAIYLYHQACDGLVPFQSGRLFGTISPYCNLGCTPWHYNYPLVYGNGAINAFLSALPGLSVYADFQFCDPFNGNLAAFECLRYANNGSYHFTANQPLRAQNVADFFSPILTARPCSLLGPSCSVTTLETTALANMHVGVNPFQDRIALFCDQPTGRAFLIMTDMTGQLIWRTEQALPAGKNEWRIPAQLPAGLYTLQVITRFGTRVWLVVHAE